MRVQENHSAASHSVGSMVGKVLRELDETSAALDLSGIA
jgi:hypothetical protein